MSAKDACISCIQAAWNVAFAPQLLRIAATEHARASFSQLISAYNDPSRSYHSLTHVASCVRQAGEARWVKPRVATAALLFHDVVYDAKSKTNEEDSARLAAETIAALVSPEACAPGAELDSGEVVRLILMTKAHAEPSDADADGKLLIDIDLSVLGASDSEFDAYDAGIRKEYAHVPDDAYRAGRTAVLRSFLSRSHIFLTEEYRAKLEAPARSNIARAIARLEDATIPLSA